jgi:transmembrane sensor
MGNDSFSEQVDWERWARYLAGELPPAEAAELERRLAANPEEREELERVRLLWDAAASNRRTWDATAALRRIEAEPTGPTRVIPLPTYYREDPAAGRRRAFDWARRAAAVLFVAGSLGGLGYLSTRPGPSPVPTPTAVVSTPTGQRASLTLPDGSQVLLGPASTMRYTIAADRGPREVSLEGEAYFTVVHDSTRPFTVTTPETVARDLGTRFLVRSYPGERATEVVVAEGIVGVGDRVLERLHRARIEGDGRIAVTRDVVLDEYLAWTEGRFVFRDRPLRDVARELSRWYDIDFVVPPEWGAKRVTARLHEQSAAEAADLIATSVRAVVVRNGKTYTLRSRATER